MTGKSTPKKTQLVAYNDPDAGFSDEDREPVPMDLESEVGFPTDRFSYLMIRVI